MSLFDQFGPLQRHDTPEYDALALVTQHPDRPKPARAADQIYMLPGSQLTQAKLIAPYLARKSVVFVGDGDCMALSISALLRAGVIHRDLAPMNIVVLDFDIRLISFIRELSREWLIDDQLQAFFYNVADAPPKRFVDAFDLFYVNPPYGSANAGFSGTAFIVRGIELCRTSGSTGVAILPYARARQWTQVAMYEIERSVLEHGYVVSEMLTGMHLYHLEDRPELRSGTVVLEQVKRADEVPAMPYRNRALTLEELKYFYGRTAIDQFPRGIDTTGNFFYDDALVPSSFVP